MIKSELIMLITNDKYEQVIAYAKNVSELSEITAIPYQCLYGSLHRGFSCCAGKFRVVKVLSNCKDYERNLFNYYQFCSDYKLKVNDYSLDLFMKISD